MWSVSIQGAQLELVQGDITQQEVDAIVNAANSSLLGGGGVDGAIHRAAGPRLLMETATLGGCKTGEAKISGGYRLPAKHVIHTVGPVYNPNDPNVPLLLASAYRESLKLAAEHMLESVALPAISTGVYGYPLAEAASISLQTVYETLHNPDARGTISLVRFVLFSDSAYDVYTEALNRLAQRSDDIV